MLCFNMLYFNFQKGLDFSLFKNLYGEGNGNPLQCSCLENSRGSRAWWAAIYGVTQSWTWLKRHSSNMQFIRVFSQWILVEWMKRSKNIYEGQNIQKENFHLDWHLAYQAPTCDIMKHFRRKNLKIQIPNRKAISNLIISKKK